MKYGSYCTEVIIKRAFLPKTKPSLDSIPASWTVPVPKTHHPSYKVICLAGASTRKKGRTTVVVYRILSGSEYSIMNQSIRKRFFFPIAFVMFVLLISRPPTVYDGVYLDISTVGIVSTPKRSALEKSGRELSEGVSFGIGTLLVVEQSSLENRPKGVWYTPSYTGYCCMVPEVVLHRPHENKKAWSWDKSTTGSPEECSFVFFKYDCYGMFILVNVQ